jgi:hypothetical protein
MEMSEKCNLYRILSCVWNGYHTVILFVKISGKFGICTVVGLNGTLVEDKIRTFMYPKCVF